MIPSWGLWLFALSGVVISAFLAYRDQLRSAKNAKEELELAKQSHAAEKATLTIRHHAEKKALEDQIRLLETGKAEVANKEILKAILASDLANLEARIGAIADMGEFSYNSSLKDGEDVETLGLLKKISADLEKHEPGLSHLFLSITGIRYSPTPSSGFGCNEKTNQIISIDHLKHFAAQLKEIIKTYK